MIELKNVGITLSSKGSEKFSLENINLKVDGEKVIILGPNGSGKTTLIRAISGLLPYTGSILIDGNEVRKIRNYTGYSTNLQEAYEIGITVKDVVYLYEEFKGLDSELFLEIIKALNLSNEILNKKLYVLSAGQSVLVRTTLALASRPKIFGLDEPFENVDAARRFVISRYIKEYGKEGILVTHELDMLSLYKDYKAYFLVGNKLQGPVSVSELLESSIVEGERRDALLTLEVMGKKISIVKGDTGMKFGALGSLNRLYGIISA
ncbi:ATP-binding cassette domain-containing protein [Sulfurisphaera ohwakuensis]|uniref:ABC-type Mn2+/Zn2+ transport system ATPase subunit n=1 Tax=Sulfurisphaera ohwakuensis TaxID=69656 RepID=A0A650CK18_SULOH|nr:ATP-binding cassette domain-containing protein [Sulfurisphaera ohwakuensis]MBB5254320.1 ABC-type Mn2+/Zn2+ transport system ATPase subunit [Sulfurisphaera ohwakuensis]QGR18211.1 ATP-binding cassette domain-containing protein [Sulfurisphaera ohwakuensis]